MWSFGNSPYNKIVYVMESMSIRTRAIFKKYISNDTKFLGSNIINWNKRGNIGVFVGNGEESTSEMYNTIAGAVDFDYILFVEPYTYLYPNYLNLVSNLHFEGKCNLGFGSSEVTDRSVLINFDMSLFDLQVGLEIKDTGSFSKYYEANSDVDAIYRTLLIDRLVFLKSSGFPLGANTNFLKYIQFRDIVTSGVYYINELYSIHLKGII